MWDGKERSRVLGAPGSNDYGGLIASSTNRSIGSDSSKLQAFSEENANDLCVRFRPLAFSIAGKYRNRGVARHELRSAGLLGLVKAARKFDPERGVPFGGFAQHWIRGEILSLFKPTRDALGRRTLSLNAPLPSSEEDEPREFMDIVADEARPAITPDLSGLSEKERNILEARLGGETLREIGRELGISAERVRQIEARARSNVKGAVAAECISALTQRGDNRNVVRFPVERTRRWEEFRDREPPRHVYREPEVSRRIVQHRIHAPRLATSRGGEPIRNPRGPYGGPIIHQWWQP
jgi:RNA polymerase sigma factor (sigma-70 family)